MEPGDERKLGGRSASATDSRAAGGPVGWGRATASSPRCSPRVSIWAAVSPRTGQPKPLAWDNRQSSRLHSRRLASASRLHSRRHGLDNRQLSREFRRPGSGDSAAQQGTLQASQLGQHAAQQGALQAARLGQQIAQASTARTAQQMSSRTGFSASDRFMQWTQDALQTRQAAQRAAARDVAARHEAEHQSAVQQFAAQQAAWHQAAQHAVTEIMVHGGIRNDAASRANLLNALNRGRQISGAYRPGSVLIRDSKIEG